MSRRRSVPAALAGGPFRLDDAAALGVTRSQLRGLQYSRPFRGVHMWGTAGGLIERCAAAQLLLTCDAAFSHQTAAALLGSSVCASEDLIHVTVPAEGTPPRRAGMRGHARELSRNDVAAVGELRVTSAARTFMDLAERLRRPTLISFGDAMLRARRASLEDFADMIERHAGRRGVQRAREALPYLDGRAESPMESVLRVMLVDGGLPAPEVNCNVYDSFGQFIARADLLYRAAKVIVEYDGDHHRLSRQQFADDARRASKLAAHGYLVLRFTSADLFDRPHFVLATVRNALAQRGF